MGRQERRKEEKEEEEGTRTPVGNESRWRTETDGGRRACHYNMWEKRGKEKKKEKGKNERLKVFQQKRN